MTDDDGRWSVLDTAPDATVIVDKGGEIVYANPRTADVLGWPPAELTGQRVEVLLPPELHQRHSDHMAGYRSGPRSRMMGVGLELVAVHRDGHRLDVEIALSPIHDSEELLVVASIRDVSERLRLTQELSETTSQLAVVDDRDRIARDLHDRVIQRLFAAGLHLQATLGRPDQDERVANVVDEIDEAIREIRTTIFTLHSPRGISAGCEPAIRAAVAESARVLGYHPRIVIDGQPALVPNDLLVEVVDVVRELLSNVAKHAQSSASTVTFDVHSDHVELRVDDDGVGIDNSIMDGRTGGDGLRNVVERAQRRGGTATFVRAPGGGTSASWNVPLPA